MDNLYVLFLNERLVGVYTSHRNATQVIWMENAGSCWHMSNYSFQMGVEFFFYEDDVANEKIYEIQEVTPDTRA